MIDGPVAPAFTNVRPASFFVKDAYALVRKRAFRLLVAHIFCAAATVRIGTRYLFAALVTARPHANFVQVLVCLTRSIAFLLTVATIARIWPTACTQTRGTATLLFLA